MQNVSSRCGNRDNAPRLRFPEFSGEWVEKKLGKIFFEINERKHPELPVLSIQQGIGTVLRDTSERRIAYDKSNINSYKVIEPGDFIRSKFEFLLNKSIWKKPLGRVINKMK